MGEPDQPLSDQQARVLDVIREFIEANGYSPTVREIAEHTDMWVSTVHQALNALRAFGMLDWADGHARTIRLTR